MGIKDGKLTKTLVPCQRCSAKVMFANRPNKEPPKPAEGEPIEPPRPQSPVHVPLNTRNDCFLVIYTGTVDKPTMWAITGLELMERVDKIILKPREGETVGKEITGTQLVGLYSSHFATCPAAAHFSHKNK